MSIRELYDRPGFLLKRCNQVSAAIFSEECAPFNITQSQYGALVVLSEMPGLDQMALARLAGLDRSTIGMVIKHLEQRGLIARKPSRLDRRKVQITLSAKGKRLLRSMQPAASRVQERVLEGLPAEKRDVFIALLKDFLASHDRSVECDSSRDQELTT